MLGVVHSVLLSSCLEISMNPIGPDEDMGSAASLPRHADGGCEPLVNDIPDAQLGPCVKCGEPLERGPWGFIDCPACNPNPARG